MLGHNGKSPLAFFIPRSLCWITVLAALLFVVKIPSACSFAEVPFTTVLKGRYSAVRQRLVLVIRLQAEWETLWHAHSSSAVSKQKPPMVDFDREMIVAVFLGERRTGGHSIAIKTVEEEPDTADLKVYYSEVSPPPNSLVTQALTPFHMIKLPRKANAVVDFVSSKG
jgi:hypothetical protein